MLHHGGNRLRRRFQMELQADDAVADLERLVEAAFARCEPDRAGRKVERLTMPVEDGEPVRPAQCAGSRSGRGRYGEPADLPCPVQEDAAAKCTGDHLRAEADADDRTPPVDRLPDQALFSDQPRVLGFVVDAHRPAHHDEQIEVVDRRQRLRLEESRRSDRCAVLLQPRQDAAGALERDVLQVVCAHTRHCT